MVNMHPQTESPFFRLPAEIRERIQRFTLIPRDESDLSTTGTANYPEILFRTHEDSAPAVMCTCKKMYREMSPFAFAEIIVHESIEDFTACTRIKCHGNLRFERLRRVSMVVAVENSNFVSPSWGPFLLSLLKRSPNVDRLDIEFPTNEFQKEVEGELSAAEERRRNGVEEERDSFTLKHYAQPDWLEEIARQPSLRCVSFEGNVPKVWLGRLRQKSEGRIQVFNDGVRFRENQEDDTRKIHTTEQDGSTDPHGRGSHGFQHPQFQIVYDHSSRFD